MVPKESGFNLSETACGLCARTVRRFLCSPAMPKHGEVIQRQHFCHYGDPICHPRSGYVTTKLHGTSTVDATTMLSFQIEQFSRFLPTEGCNIQCKNITKG